MNIGINLRPVMPGQNGGQEVYTRNLLAHILSADRKHTYCLFTAPWNDATFDFPYENCRKYVVPEPKKPEWWRKFMPGGKVNRSVLTSHLKDHHIDLLFGPMMGFGVDSLEIPGVVTIPDIQHEYYPFFFSSQQLKGRELVWKRSCFMARKVIAVSEYTKKTLMEKYGLHDDRIQVIHEAVGDEFYTFENCPPLQAVREKFSLPDLYAYYPANTWRHKNHDLLIMAFSLFKRRYRHPLKLVFTGFDPDDTSRLSRLISHYGLSEDIVHLGYVDRYEVPRLYQGASFLIYPSLYEGFGIPPLEAMAVGCPVTASGTTSIPEIVGDAALLFDPRMPDRIAESMNRMMTDQGLREGLINKGKQRAKEFSWERAAAETIQLFESLIPGK